MFNVPVKVQFKHLQKMLFSNFRSVVRQSYRVNRCSVLATRDVVLAAVSYRRKVGDLRNAVDTVKSPWCPKMMFARVNLSDRAQKKNPGRLVAH
ncbi:hypothetical protein PoB_002370000 [Plakobranchus ocellatus]|uniref:Uncharacterized protein n=1 Tax=Plakobranchus ocellatus TaxID=259542 RepID=A0AAV3ZRG9_9GAST|nr:hypothetical protein PoB_002370000 [Plakobranchus ocellatus]